MLLTVNHSDILRVLWYKFLPGLRSVLGTTLLVSEKVPIKTEPIDMNMNTTIERWTSFDRSQTFLKKIYIMLASNPTGILLLCSITDCKPTWGIKQWNRIPCFGV